MNSVISPIISRYSPRSFAERPVAENDLKILFEAARWAPSSFNNQPWRFVAGDRFRNRPTYDILFGSLVEFNAQWAGTAPVLVAAIANTITPKGDKNRFAWYDTGQAVSNLAAQATSMGMVLHQMGGFDPAKLSKDLNLPEGWESVCVIAIGYHGDIKRVPEKIQEIEIKKIRERKSLDEIVFEKPF